MKMCRNVLTFVESKLRLSSVPAVYQPVYYFYQESLNEEPSSHVLARTAYCADSYFRSAGDRWNYDSSASAGRDCNWHIAYSVATAGADAAAEHEAGQLGTSESRERSGGWSFERAPSDRSWTAT